MGIDSEKTRADLLVEVEELRKEVSRLENEARRREQAEDELRQSQKMDAIGRLAGGLAHDFNNVLTVVSGYSELLLHRMSPDVPHYKQVSEIARAADRGAALADQLLSFARRQPQEPTVLDLNATLAATSQMLRPLLGEGVQIRELPAPEPALVRADPGQMEQTLVNLAVNARDAMPEGGLLSIEISRHTEAEDGTMKAGEYARMDVTDTGTGMDPEVLRRAFEPFFTTKDVGRGTGLGLSTVYGIIEQSDGQIRMRSAPGEGSTVSVFLPCLDARHLVEED